MQARQMKRSEAARITKENQRIPENRCSKARELNAREGFCSAGSVMVMTEAEPLP
jgi:hypothetical protein